ncbi:MAG: hypothetical protein HQK91_02425 [Nitrospirae bacterium]|nr:hypothetical protein [Nitrospirota bacterium]
MVVTIVFCIVGPTALILSKYESTLLETEDKMSVINSKISMIKRDTKKIEELSTEIFKILPEDQARLKTKEQILLRLDDFESRNKFVSLKVLDFIDQGNELSLPISIDFPVLDFTKTVTLIAQLQGMKFPHFIIQSLSITSEQNGSLTCAIKGAFVCFKDGKG